ncbi:MAG: T9SS type A sorting domain-containing protein, partial [Saprospiraceae bacterium]|nr:T9SS type A sorting domain-containing protein [Saprospiraceae bacterium]
YQVVVRDTLADKFDFATLEPGASSHPYTMEFYGQRVLKFTFDNIGLPPISTDEAASIGSVQFKVKLKDNLQPPDRIENSASVYFDQNPPVVTNTYFHTISPPVYTFLEANICEGENYAFNGQLLTQQGNYSMTLTAASGVDSLVYLFLWVNEAAVNQFSEEICEGESVVFNGETLTESGDYKVLFQTVHGCDSLVNLSLDVWPVYNLEPTVQLCNGSSYALNGELLTQSGTYMAQMVSTHGCDSTVTLQLEVVDSFDIELNQSICEGETYLFNGQLLTQPGTYSAEYQTLTGCDSLVSLNLAVWPNYQESYTLFICEGDSVTWGGQTISMEGTYIDSLETVHGCDSIVIFNIEVIPTTTETIAATICQGGIYMLDGLPYGNAGTYTATLINQAGCDSLLTLVLSVEPAPVSYDTVSVVQGTNYNGIILLADTTISAVQTDMFGCEFVLVTHFIVLPNGTKDLLGQNGFEVFPNPSSGQFNVRFDLLEQRHIQLEVLDVLGRVVHSHSPKTDFAAGEHQMVVQSAAWPSGVYFVRLKVGEASFARKIMVERL